MEVQRLAFESRAAAAAAEAETAAAEARNAKTLQQESIQAKEAVHQLHRQAKDAQRQQQEQQEIIKSLLKEVETSRLELLRMQQQSGQLYVHRFPNGRCCVTGTSRAQLSFVSSSQALVPQRRIRALICGSTHSSKSFSEEAEAPFVKNYSYQGPKRLLPFQYFQQEATLQDTLQSLSRTSEIITQKKEAAHERLWNIRNKTFNTSSASNEDLQQMTTGVKTFQSSLQQPSSVSLGLKPPLACSRQRQQQQQQPLQPPDAGFSELTDGMLEATCASLASLEEVAAAPPVKNSFLS
ncbi:hypothetical protein EBH_0044900 [Eimeria brunetti]|uniref:Uncharacterized protein n=1 Tax=Eimeria brunetti TaxID=51314 RepID=U6LRD2_9EIME|nr:hypothetical protein EBH_0044900 [Eimeria brunetti]